MKFYIKKSVWRCKNCGNKQTTTPTAGEMLKQPHFCKCKQRNYELVINACQVGVKR